LPELVYARQEGREIARVVSDLRSAPDGTDDRVALRLGARATRKEFERLTLRSSRWLHLACHGVVDPERPWASRIILARDGSQNPNLTAASVLRRRLVCELAVLSCCSTGGGRIISGEGVLGLPRAFLAAGARAVCATHWPVVDASGPPLMIEMYRRLASGDEPHDALRAAQLAQANAELSPDHWAGYYVIG
jgi:CHAT domain-containing protein